MKLILSTALVLSLALSLSAQEYEVPKYNLKKAGDFAQYEKDVIGAVNWLMDTPVDAQPDKRKEVNKFLVEWISGSPNVSIEIKQEIVTFMSPNADLLVIYMGGWTKYVLETKDTDKQKGTLNGLEYVIQFYQKNKDKLKRDKNVEKYIGMKEKGKLEDFVKKNA